jgi:hypothetical protein
MHRFTRRPSPAMAVAFIALLAALSGTAVALPGKNTVDSGDIKRGAVKRSDVGRNAVTGAKVRNGSLTGADARNESLTGADVVESSLGKVPSAASADSAATATNADMLDGLDSAAYVKNGDAAGGALAGTFPNPSLADGAVTATKLATLTERMSAITAVPAGQSVLAVATCEPGERVIGGGGAWQTPSNTDHLQIVHSFVSLGTNDWRVRAFNGTAAAENFFAQAICLSG